MTAFESIRQSLVEIERHRDNIYRQLAVLQQSEAFLHSLERSPTVGTSLDQISMVVMGVFEITPEQLFGRARPDYLCSARHAYCLLARELTPHSLREIGRHLGGRDHSSACHGAASAQAKAEQDSQFLARLNLARQRLLQLSQPKAA